MKPVSGGGQCSAGPLLSTSPAPQAKLACGRPSRCPNSCATLVRGRPWFCTTATCKSSQSQNGPVQPGGNRGAAAGLVLGAGAEAKDTARLHVLVPYIGYVDLAREVAHVELRL